MGRHVAVVGAGIGGLSAAVSLARRGCDVTLLEARSEVGGLAGSTRIGATCFDSGPYVLLDRPGLEWSLGELGSGTSALELERVDPAYSVQHAESEPVVIHADLDRTAEGFERRWPGSARSYIDFIERCEHQAGPVLAAQRHSPSARAAIRSGMWRNIPMVLRSLGAVLRGAQLPDAVIGALGIWTQVAGHSLRSAPGPMSLVPWLIHRHGAWRPRVGLSAVARLLERLARQEGVDVRTSCPVQKIAVRGGRIAAVETEGSTLRPAAIVSSVGLATYLDLVDADMPTVRRRCAALPLQSPGVCAYMNVRGRGDTYLRFWAPPGQLTRLLVSPPAGPDGVMPARLISPLEHRHAQAMSPEQQQAFLDRLLAEGWWQEGVSHYEVVARRTPSAWGDEFGLYADAMNPVMTRSFMLRGRIPHRSRSVRGLYLAGASTHPGQWVSFCAISGILAADALMRDLAV